MKKKASQQAILSSYWTTASLQFNWLYISKYVSRSIYICLGIGGGSIFVILLVLIGSFEPSYAVPISHVLFTNYLAFNIVSNRFSSFTIELLIFFLSQFSLKTLILGGALVNFCFTVSKRHPKFNRPLIDYNLALVLFPPSLAGSICRFWIQSNKHWLFFFLNWISW
jgi:uncharacterized membrane protein YfcA